MKRQQKYLFISIKEKYANRILDGSKEIELRKSRPNVTAGDRIIIYCTSPVKAIVATAKVAEVVTHRPRAMWSQYSQRVGISREDFFDYYQDSEKAVGIVLVNVEKLNISICLDLIRQHLPAFTPPQTYKYFTNFIPPEREQTLVLEPARKGL